MCPIDSSLYLIYATLGEAYQSLAFWHSALREKEDNFIPAADIVFGLQLRISK
jgi:hypothetical protein